MDERTKIKQRKGAAGPCWWIKYQKLIITNNKTKNPAYKRESILLVRQNSPKNQKKIARQLYTLYEKKFPNMRPLLSITFSQ